MPIEIESVILRALASDPENRLPSMEALDYEINKVLSGRGAAVGKLLGLSPQLVAPARGATPQHQAAGGRAESGLTPLSGEVRRVFRRKRVTAVVGGAAMGAILLAAGLTASRRPVEEEAAGSLKMRPVSVVSAPSPSPAVAAGPAPVAPVAMVPKLSSKAEAKRSIAEERATDRRLLADARAKLAGGKYAAAQKGFQRLLDGPERAAALTGIAECAFQQGQYGDAAKAASRAVAAGGGFGAHLVLGNAYFKQKKFAEASREYQAVLRERPRHTEAKRNLDVCQRVQSLPVR